MATMNHKGGDDLAHGGQNTGTTEQSWSLQPGTEFQINGYTYRYLGDGRCTGTTPLEQAMAGNPGAGFGTTGGAANGGRMGGDTG